MLGGFNDLAELKRLEAKFLQVDDDVTWFLISLPRKATIEDICFYNINEFKGNPNIEKSTGTIYKDAVTLSIRWRFNSSSLNKMNVVNLFMKCRGLVCEE